MKMRLLFVFLVLTVLLGINLATYANSNTIHVPDNYPTLQEAINAAEDGDIIIVTGGTYKGNINFKGKSLTLTSTNPDSPSLTTIEGTSSGSVITIDSNSVIKGFTITSKDINARGIYIKDANPTIENCAIIGNEAGGIYSTDNSRPQIINCIITDNTGKESEEQVAGGKPKIIDSFIEEKGLVDNTILQNQSTSQITDTSSILTMSTMQTDGGLIIEDMEDDGITAYDLAYALVGNLPGVEIFNVTCTDEARALGMFTGGGTDQETEVGITEGAILSTGKVKNAVGPNQSDGTTTEFNSAGDNDLTAMLESYGTFDAAVLEFDFTAISGEINLSYVFGSEEYNEYVHANPYHDLFGFWINGVQSALLPDGETYIGVKTINVDSNAEFYRNNDSRPGPIDCEMDGLTVVFTLTAPINPAPEVNHIKIAIADARDCKRDAIVFVGYNTTSRWYVDDDAPSGGDGRTWATAFKYLQDALNNIELKAGDEIRVACGIQKPDRAETFYIEPTDKTASFQLINGIVVKGGYAGLSNPSNPNERDTVNYKTILSGDLGVESEDSDNSYHVVNGSNTDATTILDGFTITCGNATGSSEKAFGGGLFNRGIQAGSPTITNCIFTYNRAYYGGAVHNGPFPGSPPKEQNLRTVLTNCIFDNNTAREGGAINGSFLGITNCVFTNNTADANGRYGYGGAIAGGDGETTNCTFYGNTAVTQGGAICTGVRSMTITNSIFWGNSDDIVGSPFIHYCDVENPSTIGDNRWIRGTGNISADPLFANPGNPLNHGLRLVYGSPCIDAANGDTAPLTDILDQERIDIPEVPNATSIPADIGAYEYEYMNFWHVDSTAPLGGNGASWETAFRYLQDALNNPKLKAGSEILVAQGIYKPDRAETFYIEPEDRTASFHLIKGVNIKGGYAGLSKPWDLYERDMANYQTILSGDLRGNDGPDFTNYDDNSRNIITAGKEITENTLLEGLIITGGNASDESRNQFERSGCGMYNDFGSSPTVKNCVFMHNNAGVSGGLGGAVLILDKSHSKFINCIFYHNYAGAAGGAVMIFHNSYPEFINCVFGYNSAGTSGGAMNIISLPWITKNTKITNCTFFQNHAPTGGHIENIQSHTEITNSIFWSGGSNSLNDKYGNYLSVTYSDIEGGYTGKGNINSEPLFVNNNPSGEDGIFGTEDDGLRLRHGGSPCVDTANHAVAPSTDMLGDNRFGIADMGAYEFKHDGSLWDSLPGFSSPHDVHYDSASGYLYVADTDNHRIVKTRMDGTGWTAYGSIGSGTGKFNSPQGIYYDSASDYIYVADTKNHRIVRFKMDEPDDWTAYGSFGSGIGRFNSPQGIYYDAGSSSTLVWGDIYVADTNNHSIVRTKINGIGWTALGTGGEGIGQFNYPTNVYGSWAQRHILVTDRLNYRIVKTRMDGTGWDTLEYISSPFGLHYDSRSKYIYITQIEMGPGCRIIRTQIDGTGWTTYGSHGYGIKEFRSPRGIYYDNDSGYIYVADTHNDRIVRAYPEWTWSGE
ncbi:MAG: choice-of-anchor L domain-containing protein [Candidatus Ratteibacteria bacterium]|nr:choice-of-anchor L domain-containing protein [Candidatus Ratteibacteria bacterium]